MPNPLSTPFQREQIRTLIEHELKMRVADGSVRGPLPDNENYTTGEREREHRAFEGIRDDSFEHADRDLIVNTDHQIVHRVSGVSLVTWLDGLIKAKPHWSPLAITDQAEAAFGEAP